MKPVRDEAAILDRRLGRLYALVWLVGAIWIPFFVLWLKDRGFSPSQTGLVLGASALAGLLIGTGRRLHGEPVTAQGSGLVDVGAAAAGELAASPGTLALGRSTGAGWRVNAAFALTNLTTRRLHLTLAVRTQDEGAAAVDGEGDRERGGERHPAAQPAPGDQRHLPARDAGRAPE